jgi:phosphohistidine phosphatase SixA
LPDHPAKQINELEGGSVHGAILPHGWAIGGRAFRRLTEKRLVMVIFVLRHADKLIGQNEDGLNPQGIERARLLARMLAGSGITRAYHSEAVRTLQTVEPLKQRLGAALVVKKIKGGAAGHVAGVIEEAASLPAETVVLVVSHSDTVKLIIKGLGGGDIETIEDHEFDQLFVLFRSAAGAIGLAKMKYGEPT